MEKAERGKDKNVDNFSIKRGLTDMDRGEEKGEKRMAYCRL